MTKAERKINDYQKKYTSQENKAFIKYLRESDEAILFPDTPLEMWKETFILNFRRN